MNLCHRSGPGWYVAQVAPGAVDKARAGLKDLGLATYHPVERMTKVVRGRKVDTARPLFVGYLFVALDLLRDEWQAVELVDGVIDVLANNDVPSRIPTAWVEALQHAESVGIFDRTKREPNGFKVGQEILVGEGPFAGHRGVIQEFIAKLKSVTARKRAKVLVSFMGRMTALELPVESMEKA